MSEFWVDQELQPVHPETREWAAVEQYMKISCRTSRICLSRLWKSAPADVSITFYRAFHDKHRVLAWVDDLTISEDGRNSISEVCRRGFRVPKSGMTIKVGNFIPPSIRSNAE
eukprot:Trichotokara_eunicae@DN4380_c0_g1_i3.p1